MSFIRLQLQQQRSRVEKEEFDAGSAFHSPSSGPGIQTTETRRGLCLSHASASPGVFLAQYTPPVASTPAREYVLPPCWL